MNNEKKKEKLSKEEVKNLVEMFRLLMGAYGFFAEKLGEIQRDHEEAYTSMFSPTSLMEIPEMMSEMAEKTPEFGKLFTRVFIKLSSYLPQLSNLMNLSAEEKIRLGKNLRLLAKDFSEMSKWTDEVKEE